MKALHQDVDPDGLLEYSVVYTDRALNHMSKNFQRVMREISGVLKTTYRAHSAIVVPGSGTFGMEAVARQFATDQKVLVIRNGWFSYRWSQIFEMGRIPRETLVLKAREQSPGTPQSPFAPPPIEEVVATIRAERPALVFAPHVETAAGLILPDDYLRQIGEAVRAHDGLFVLDCVASGCTWVDMQASAVDVLVSAPQKGWSSTPCAGLVMLGERARARIEHTTSTSFAADLKKWLSIMETYESGAHAYHATMPTDALRQLAAAMAEAGTVGLDVLAKAQQTLGAQVRELLESRGYPSVAAEGFRAPSVVVSHTDDPELQNGKRFLAAGLQIAAGVPLQVDEPKDFRTFRIGLFGLDKLTHLDRTVDSLRHALDTLRG